LAQTPPLRAPGVTYPAAGPQQRPLFVNPRAWRNGDPVPPGWVKETQVRRGLIIGGAAMLGGAWVGSSIAAGLGSTISSNKVFTSDWSPLAIPVVGPFVAMTTLDSEGVGTALLAMDGLVQVGGLVMIIVGATAKKTTIRPLATTELKPTWEVTPVLSSRMSGMSLSGRF